MGKGWEEMKGIGFANMTTVTSSGNLLVKQLKYLPGSDADRSKHREPHSLNIFEHLL